ncbi:MAG: hypothetical protein LDL33_05780 [Desulfomonile sp.]|nr:hypothetical protein [Desulfomonile sp.]
MCKVIFLVLVLVAAPFAAVGQQVFRAPDVKSMKHLTTKRSDHARDIPGEETTMDYYIGQNGEIITMYSFRGRTVAFSAHSNTGDQQGYRLYMDLKGDGLFQQVNVGPDWQIPQWAR